jgi:spore coat protein U-like protein
MAMIRQSRRETAHAATAVGGAATSRRAWLRLAAVLAVAAWAPAAAAQRCTGLAASSMVFTGFGPSGPGVAATATLTYSCEPGVTQAWIGIFDQRAVKSSGNTLQFEIYQGPDRSTVWPDAPPLPVPVGVNVSVTVYGFLFPQDAAAGTYTGAQRVVLYAGSNQNKTDQVNMLVSAIVPPSCTIAAGTLTFGGYDPLGANAASPLDAQGTLQIACTRSTIYAVGLGPGSFPSGATRQMASGTERLAYELYRDAGRTAKWSTTATVGGTAPSTAPIVLPVYGRIPGGQAVLAGPYGDIVQSTVNF